MTSSAVKRSIVFRPGFDCIRFECRHESKDCEPGGGGSHGRGGVDICFFVEGEKGTVQFCTSTGWPVEPEEKYSGLRVQISATYPSPYDLGYHSPVPMYEGQTPMEGKCEYVPGGGECFYDGSGLNAEEPFRVLCNEGTDPLWEYLEAVYRCQFEEGEWPQPKPYKLARRTA